MRLGARLAVLLRLKRVQNPYRRLYPGRARVDAAHPFQKRRKEDVFVQKFLADPGPRRGKR